MSFISTILSGSTKGLIEGVGSTIKKFVTTDGDRMKMQLELEELLQKRDSEVEQTIRTELETKEKIIVAELQQGDNYTKRARPTVVYFGLLVIFYNYCVIPTTQLIRRSAEKRGSRSKVTSFITG